MQKGVEKEEFMDDEAFKLYQTLCVGQFLMF